MVSKCPARKYNKIEPDIVKPWLGIEPEAVGSSGQLPRPVGYQAPFMVRLHMRFQSSDTTNRCDVETKLIP